jgi:hypothetical protein
MVKTIVSVIAIIAVVAFFIVFDGRKKRPRKTGGLSGEPTIKVDSNEESDCEDGDKWQPNWFDIGEDELGRAELAARKRKNEI